MFPSPESELSGRYSLPVARLKQLHQWHQEYERRERLSTAFMPAAGVGLLFLLATWGLAFGVYGTLIEPARPNAALFATCFAVPPTVLVVWRVVRWRRIRQRAIAFQALQRKIIQMLSEFPERVQSWGGPQALCNGQHVRALLRSLEGQEPSKPLDDRM